MQQKIYNLTAIISGDFERYKVYYKPYKVPYNNGYTGKRGEAKNPENSLIKSMIRAKNKIHGYVMANDWDYWATQTFDPKKLDRFNLDEITKKYNQKLYDLKRRKYNNLKWLIVPEQHKNKAWHLHMFISGIPKERIKYSEYDYFNKEKRFSRRVYNWLDTINYGFNDYIYIGDCEPLERFKMANYVMKYITKDLVQSRFNKKKYWCSRGLKKPTVTNTWVSDKKLRSLKGPDKLIITENDYYINNPETGEVFNKINDFTIYNPLPF